MKLWFDRIINTTPADGWLAVFRNEEEKSFTTERLAVWVSLRSEEDGNEDDYFGVIGLGVVARHLDPMSEAQNFERYVHENDLLSFASRKENVGYTVFLPTGHPVNP